MSANDRNERYNWDKDGDMEVVTEGDGEEINLAEHLAKLAKEEEGKKHDTADAKPRGK